MTADFDHGGAIGFWGHCNRDFGTEIGEADDAAVAGGGDLIFGLRGMLLLDMFLPRGRPGVFGLPFICSNLSSRCSVVIKGGGL